MKITIRHQITFRINQRTIIVVTWITYWYSLTNIMEIWQIIVISFTNTCVHYREGSHRIKTLNNYQHLIYRCSHAVFLYIESTFTPESYKYLKTDYEEFKDSEGVIRLGILKNNSMAKRKSTKGQTTIYKTYT